MCVLARARAASGSCPSTTACSGTSSAPDPFGVGVPGRAGLDRRGTARQERGLKHRADNETGTIPIPPVLVRLLRAHIKMFGTAPDGRIFQTARGGILQDSGYNEVLNQARKTALTPPVQVSARPPPLRPAPRRRFALA